jgi:membrane protein DedA with SNARE-associated domain
VGDGGRGRAPGARRVVPDLRPWAGRAERADWIIITGIGARGIYGLATLPLIPLLLASHPLLLTLLSGSTVAEVTLGAQVRVGEVSWPVAILAGIPAWLLFDWLYWWAGRRWRDRALTLFLGRGGRPGAARRAARVERVVHRLGPWGVLLAWFLPVPSVVVYAAAGLAGMRLVTFLLLDLLGTAAAVTVVVALGYALGQRAIDLVHRLDDYALVLTVALVVVVVAVQVVRQRGQRRTG